MAGIIKPTGKPAKLADGTQTSIVDGRQHLLLLPAWLIIGVLLVIPVLLMLTYSFLVQDFRGGVIWEFSLEAYDQFFFDRGLFGDEPPSIEWTYIGIFWRSFVQALLAMIFCFSDWFSYSLFYCYTAAKIAGVLAVSCDDTLLGQSVDPDSIDEISDS